MGEGLGVGQAKMEGPKVPRSESKRENKTRAENATFYPNLSFSFVIMMRSEDFQPTWSCSSSKTQKRGPLRRMHSVHLKLLCEGIVSICGRGGLRAGDGRWWQ